MDSSVRAAVEAFIEREGLPGHFMATVEQWYLPLAEDLLRRAAIHRGTCLVGISGSQGSGKSTLAQLLVILLKEMMGLSAIDLSLDDFYLTRARRQALAEEVHPLFRTRGVPGTHDVNLALETLDALSVPGQVAVPRFDKAEDDRCEPDRWPRVAAPVDVVVLEGWCLGIPPQDDEELEQPINDLERREDPDGIWRRQVNEQIRRVYCSLYERIDYLVMLKAPDFQQVFEWRRRQEEKLAARSQGAGIMSDDQLKRFIQHYERLTRHGLRALPERADVVFQLSEDQTIADSSLCERQRNE